MDDFEDVGCFCVKEVFLSFWVVVWLVENCCECEEEYCDSNEFVIDIVLREYFVECVVYEGCIGEVCGNFICFCIEYIVVEIVGGENYEGCYCVDYYCICKYFEDILYILFYGFFNVGVGVNYNGRIEFCFVGENVVFEVVCYSNYDIVDFVVDKCFGSECVCKDSFECREDCLIVDIDDNKVFCNEKNDYKGNDFFCNVCDFFDIVEGDYSGKKYYNYIDENVVERNVFKYGDIRKCLNVKCCGNVCNNFVYLIYIFDIEGCEYCEDIEVNCKNFVGSFEGCFVVSIFVGIFFYIVL